MATRNAASMGDYGSSWQHRGYSGSGNVASLMDCHKDRPAIVAGSAMDVFAEVDYARAKYPDNIVFGANDVGMYLPKLDHWVSLHADHLNPWKQVRWIHERGPESIKYHSATPRAYVDYNWEGLTPLFAVSGYFAMQIAWLMGCSPIILCGVPGSPRRRFFEGRARDDFGYGGGGNSSDQGIMQQLTNEMERLPDFRVTVRSMSGFTRDYFGGLD